MPRVRTGRRAATTIAACILLVFIARPAVAAAAAAPAQLKPADWPGFRGPGGQGTSAAAATGLPLTWGQGQNLAWKTPLPGPGTSSPILLDGRIYLTCYTGYNVPGQGEGDPEQLKRHVVCLDADSGRILWEKPFAAKLPEQGRIREGHGYASSTLATDGQRLYAFFGKSGVLALDLAGKQLWHADVGSGLNGWGTAASPVLFENLVIINAAVESESLVALDKATGQEVWRARGIKESWNTPIIVSAGGGRTELVLAMMGKVLGFDPKSGQQLWSCATDIPWYMVPSLSAHEGIVYCIGGRSGGGALAVRTGGRGDVTRTHRLWMLKKGSNVPSPVYHDGHLYWINDSTGVACCVDAKTGDVVYEERAADRMGQVYAPALLAGGRIYYTSRTGQTVVLPAAPKFERLAYNDLSDRSTFNAGLAVSGDRFYLRSDKFLYCIAPR